MTDKPTSILVVDDVEGTRYTLVRMLQKASYQVQEAGTGADALRLAAEHPDLIILDINLPDLSGHEVRRRLKDDPATAAIPVLHLSASFVESDNRAEGLEGGADGYLTYPVEPRELLATIEALLRARRAEREARAQREFLHVTLSSIGDAVIATDAAGRVTFLNPAAQALTGWGQGEAEARPLAEVFRVVDERTRAPARDPAERVLREGKVVELSNHSALVARDGTERLIDDSAAPIRDAGGRVVGVVLVFRDVTERRKAEEEVAAAQGRVQLVADAVPALISYIDSQARYRLNNRAYETWFGHPRSELAGRHMREVLGEQAWATIRTHVEAALAGQVVRYEREVPYKDGGTRWIDSTYTPDRDGEGAVRGFVAHVNDVTARKRLEEELRQRMEELAEQDRRKDEFLAMLAHELRNPLAPLRNALHLVRLIDPTPRPGVQEARDLMERQVEHLVRLVDDLLDMSRINRGQIQLQKERVDLAAVVSRAVESSRPVIDARRHALEVSLPAEVLPVEADPVRLAQVFLNLLTNAAKYTPEGGRIRLTAAVEGDRGEGPGADPAWVVVRVRDTGVGIAAEMLPKVFDLFTQVERNLDRAEGGLGIGLTLVRQLTELHGGSVEAYSEGHGRGSEFVVRLPVAPAAGPEKPAGGAGRPRPAPRRILVVDDNRDSAESLATLLRLLGNDVRTAYDGRLALEVAPAYRPDVILLDIGLPGMNGLEVCQRLRGDPQVAETVVVAMTGYGLEDDKQRSREAGFDAHLVKPVDLEALQELLASPELAGKR